jgi:hypothetical protein
VNEGEVVEMAMEEMQVAYMHAVSRLCAGREHVRRVYRRVYAISLALL